MRRRGLILVLLLFFAAVLGHLAWNTAVGPPVSAAYFVGGPDLPALASPHADPEHKSLYLRRNLYLSQRPRHAWIQLLGRDDLLLVVNGRVAEEQNVPGFPVGIVMDITSWLHGGHNVIAVVNRRSNVDHPPIVAIDGAYLLDDGEHPIGPDSEWRSNSVFDRIGHYWFAIAYDDRKWETARLTTANLRAKALVPPRSAVVAQAGKWISSPVMDHPNASLRREFFLDSRPKCAWLRATAKSSYRLAVNGLLVDEQEDQIGTDIPVPPMERVYDITPLLKKGKNVLAVALTKSADFPRLLIDGEIEGLTGEKTWIGTDEHWLGCPGLIEGWQSEAPANLEDWRPCRVDFGDQGVLPWQPRRHRLEVVLPAWELARRIGVEAAFIGLVLSATALCCWLAGRLLLRLRGGSGRAPTPGVVYLALVPGILAGSVGLLATLDPRFGPEDVYRPLVLWTIALSVPLQWALLALGAALGRATARPLYPPLKRSLALIAMLVIVSAGFWLRGRALAEEPLHWDEVENARGTQGFLERGFPSYSIGEHLPPKFMETSELVFVISGVTALFFEDGRYVLRVPSICWSTLTIILLYVMGTRLFSRPVGLVAAAIFAFSPMGIGMCNFGRYFAQVQFLALFTLYTFWLTIKGTGPINQKALWLTALAFIGVYLSWEVAALIALGMIVAVLVYRRGRLYTVLGNGWVWLAMLLVLLAVGLQYSNRELSQTQYVWYGISISDISLRAMWRYPVFRPLGYFFDATWNQDTLLPMLGMAAAFALAARHVFRRGMRYMLIVFCITCGSMALILPAFAARYGDFLMPMLVLICSAVAVALARALVKLARTRGQSIGWAGYAGSIAALAVCTLVAAGSGWTVQLFELSALRVPGYGVRAFKFPNLQGPTEYLYSHVQKGDVVLASDAQQIRYLMRELGDRSAWPEYRWLANTLFLPATMDDVGTLPRDRRDGTILISSLEELEELFARHRRIWYIVCPDQHLHMNTPDITTFVAEHMDVVHEDFDSFLFLRSNNHRNSELRERNLRELKQAGLALLPSMTGG